MPHDWLKVRLTELYYPLVVGCSRGISPTSNSDDSDAPFMVSNRLSLSLIVNVDGFFVHMKSPLLDGGASILGFISLTFFYRGWSAVKHQPSLIMSLKQISVVCKCRSGRDSFVFTHRSSCTVEQLNRSYSMKVLALRLACSDLRL